MCPHELVSGQNAEVHQNERAVVWFNPTTGDFKYPGRNDAPISDRNKKLGYVRKELPHLRDIQAHEKQTGRVNEIAHFDSGSGRDMFHG